MPSTPRAPERGDLILSVVVTAIALAMLALLPAISSVDPDVTVEMPGPSDWQWWVVAAAVLAQGARLAWISTAPRHVLVAMPALALLVSLVPLGEASGIPLVAVIAAAYVATRKRASAASWTPWIIATVLTAGAGVISNLRLDDGLMVPVAAAVGQAVVVVGVPTAIAAAASARHAMATSREREALARAGELEARMDAALAAERTAIARELHDIAAHHLSGIALMSSAISQQIDMDPATAKAGLADVRAQTRSLLDELRGLVALLRSDDGVSVDGASVDGAPVDVQSLAGLETLIPAARARGLDVTLAIPDGASMRDLSRGIGPLGQFAAYRTVQEALANAARHAPGGRCTVELRDSGDDHAGDSDHAADSLEILVSNGPGTADAAVPAGAHHQGGFGLRGMEERAALTRSSLTYGPTDDGGWRVLLWVPREAGHDGDPITTSTPPDGAQP
ncbi:sensor histidine kinase [Demequina muriae]|uniref:histidine kinase n=1 Tax=Demequina muriae TaxID=3051664 RepID=A0ABT8GDD9_9MICO|nr:histidine kinase [Demequina sp. EGI L300058]MDN4479448.1 histidine kinase [Demequina sp. EGI L300058]